MYYYYLSSQFGTKGHEPVGSGDGYVERRCLQYKYYLVTLSWSNACVNVLFVFTKLDVSKYMILWVIL